MFLGETLPQMNAVKVRMGKGGSTEIVCRGNERGVTARIS